MDIDGWLIVCYEQHQTWDFPKNGLPFWLESHQLIQSYYKLVWTLIRIVVNVLSVNMADLEDISLGLGARDMGRDREGTGGGRV
ncbi:hypothetical protein N39L_09930 [Limnospira platensis NIES-39]|uniref:Transposase n=1 Tax=Limnospira platensis NIES-46 TaxID=1236695 RepID=A0A5M3TC91_LIMPL|nr:hypothetical protein AP285_04520 [Arthrospira platensis YZ]KDR57709.1 hypothetical protein APPUASWS_009555 [Arthrospira platensis str. Paraca]BAI88864.1 hypothetical protein NIES39_B01070 [Arthrospira platensis NIES-39]BDT11270.1 hypothetical protein N39L_09930 [Arthrospira platensis NIES-39]GCE95506.1 hypothetical protein NIES46_35710 [Arthrospira platensis NIES-46]